MMAERRDVRDRATRPGRGPRPRGLSPRVTRVLCGLVGIALGVLAALYYTGVIGTVYGHKSKIVAKATKTTSAKRQSVWSLMRLDEYDNPTAYALTELDGTELAALLAKKGFSWVDGVGWTRDGAIVCAMDEDGRPVGKVDSLELEPGCAGTTGYYMLVTFDYADAGVAYQALVGDVMESVRLVDAGVGLVGSAYGPSMRDYAIYAISDGVSTTMYVLGEDAVGAGVLERLRSEAQEFEVLDLAA